MSPLALIVAASVASAVSFAARPAFAADSTPSPFTFHGALTQAYARSDGETVLGIPKRGTSDYRTVSLQFGYALGAKDRIVVQLAHERIGESPAMAFRQDVELDWAFYEHRFSDAFAVKAGRVQIPWGIFNETRDIGTLLPFYRPPTALYSETVGTSEAVDGIVVSTHLRRDKPWSIDGDLYAGSWDTLQPGPAGLGLERLRVENALGLHVWVQTPLSGLRVGGGVMRLTSPNSPQGAIPANYGQFSLSAEGLFGPVTLRAEHAYFHSPATALRSSYAQVGVRLWRGLILNAEVQENTLNLRTGFLLGTFHLVREVGVGLNYELRPDLVVKLEGRRNRGSDLGTPSPKSLYGIAGVSVSF